MKEARLEALELKVEQQQEMIAALQKKNNERPANSIYSKPIPSDVDGNEFHATHLERILLDYGIDTSRDSFLRFLNNSQ